MQPLFSSATLGSLAGARRVIIIIKNQNSWLLQEKEKEETTISFSFVG
jgi:hypothetical protein